MDSSLPQRQPKLRSIAADILCDYCTQHRLKTSELLKWPKSQCSSCGVLVTAEWRRKSPSTTPTTPREARNDGVRDHGERKMRIVRNVQNESYPAAHLSQASKPPADSQASKPPADATPPRKPPGPFLTCGKMSHNPTTQDRDFPVCFLRLMLGHGFTFSDPYANSRDDQAVSALVGSFWQKVMPSSSCWMIHSQHRVIAFDAEDGAVAGACYCDTNNRYIPCVGVAEKYRRSGLGSMLVAAAVSICEATPPYLLNARPNLCVSPKDIVHHPHLHKFYITLGFKGGRPGFGGNYVLPETTSGQLLERF